MSLSLNSDADGGRPPNFPYENISVMIFPDATPESACAFTSGVFRRVLDSCMPISMKPEPNQALRTMTHEDFEAIFDRNSSLDAFRVFYPDAEACYSDYAQRMSKRFSAPSPGCECCGSTGLVCRKVATWEVNYQNRKSLKKNLFGLLFILVGHIHMSRAVLRFSTEHSICKSCVFRFSLKRLLTVPASFVATITSYLPVIIGVFGVFYLGVGLASDEKPGLVAWSVVATATIATPLLFWIRRQSDLLTIPAFLRAIAKDPILFRGFAK